MSINHPSQRECATETPVPSRKRSQSYAEVSNMYSTKRRRVSMAIDSPFQHEMAPGSGLRPSISVDRFVPFRPNHHLPLNTTPRTNRLGRQFGLVNERVFNFKENLENEPPDRNEGNMLNLLRRSASDLFLKPPRFRPSSVTENLMKQKQSVLTLDGPRISNDAYGSPITWSKRNLIAVACSNDVYYQNLNNKVVSHMCEPHVGTGGSLHAIEWAGEGRETLLASGTSTGVVQVWDAGLVGGKAKHLRLWQDGQSAAVGGLDWYDDLLAVGSHNGTISLFDIRSKAEANSISAHKDKIIGLKWSVDGSYLASGDEQGTVYVWDKKAGKELFSEATKGRKMKQSGPVKALAWCPWKPDLLATGSLYPEGIIRIWSMSSPSSHRTPLKSLDLNSSIYSLHWSPHCKELLSTHGPSFQPCPRPNASNSGNTPVRPNQLPKIISTPLTNSIAVHDYPSGKRLLALPAHIGPVIHSCLSPDGQNVFTVCPREETIKMWQVWSKRVDSSKRESAFDKCTIR
ncbi:quinon protein alcohol dehydrogenase-like superfamily [Collybia nuda]|uniref:Quinon protein alcohol dehydrogenase-like superfamily n=1 Tax=Collybia nuda TaxID=64659 RepID=A0A9P6CF76_9AGAR|nr:quinon protein alcohol dehydrogenase-like superfamily [Collybia nuda]